MLAIDHTAGVVPFRKKFRALAEEPGLDLTVLAPERWVENYREVRAVQTREDGYRLLTGRVVWPGYENRGFFVSGLDCAFRAAKPDLIHLWEEPFSFITLEALAVARFRAPRAPVIFSTSDDRSAGFRYDYRPSWLYARIERATLRRAAGATVINEAVFRLLREKGFEKPIERIPHGLELERYPCSLEARAARAGDPDHVPVVGFLGKLTRQKGVDVLLAAFSRLRRRTWRSAPVLEIVGDGPERPRLQALATELAAGASVRFREPVAHEDVPRVLSGFDILVLPARTTPTAREQFGRVLIEGMAAGCVVIGTESGAIPEVIGEVGLVVPEEGEEALTAAIERVLRDPALAADRRVRGRERVRERYTWRAVASTLASFYRRMTA
ncbi:MAG TPA: glycosyltransferase family 4 protein [Candidatus Eisenbacteria bacterium]|nr:glycosyltransferase family 4 protein [Candidatus Eisenbacteria bacterium]